eukprot:COSAG01_NODE_6018_length_3899_cov_14.690263_5_plen_168_part_01
MTWAAPLDETRQLPEEEQEEELPDEGVWTWNLETGETGIAGGEESVVRQQEAEEHDRGEVERLARRRRALELDAELQRSEHLKMEHEQEQEMEGLLERLRQGYAGVKAAMAPGEQHRRLEQRQCAAAETAAAAVAAAAAAAVLAARVLQGQELPREEELELPSEAEPT